MQTRPPWWINHQATRRPVSRGRQIMGVVVAIVLLLGWFGWRYVTDEERLRWYAETWLESFSGGEARVDRVEFNLFRGLNLIGVTLAVPESAQFNPHDNSLEARTLFRCASVFLQLRPLSIITGHLAVPEIVAVHPELRLIHRTADGVGNWQLMFERREDVRQETPRALPAIRLRDARWSQLRLEEDGRLEGHLQTVWADAVPVSEANHTYRLEVTRFLREARGAPVTGETGYVEINLETLALSARVPWISVAELSFTAPRDVQRWLELLGIHGYVSSDYLRYEPGRGGEVHLVLRDAGISIPIDEEDRGRPARKRYLRFDHVNGTLNIENRRARMRLDGRFHGAPVRLRGRLSLPEGEVMAFDEMGFAVQILAEELVFPRHEAADDPSQAEFVLHWKHLRNFMEDFDPRGRATLNVTVNKHPGAGHGIEFVEGTLELHEISAAYFRFPYRFENLSGSIHWRPDRKVEIRELRGRRGAATVRVNGLHQGYHSQGFDVAVQASNVPMDDYLLSHMSEADRDLVERCQAEARMDIELRTHRRDLPAGTPDNPARSDIDVAFLDGRMQPDAFEYPLEQLDGYLRIRGNTYIFDGFSGRRGRTRVELNGRVVRDEDRDVRFEIDLNATDLALDDTLASALPMRIREAYRRLSPTGRADVIGRVRSEGLAEPLDYDLLARLVRLELHVPEPRMHLVEGRAEMRLRPGGIEVPEFTCRLGRSPLQAHGSLVHGVAEPRFHLRVVSPQLHLEETVYQALPDATRAIWDEFAPQGEVRLDLELSNRSTASRPAEPEAFPETGALSTREAPSAATQPAAEERRKFDYHLVIEPIDARMTYARFPVPLDHVTGRIEVNSERVALTNVKARHGDSTIELEGIVDRDGGGVRTELKIRADDLAFSEPLRQAVPWRIRRLWNDARPEGRFDLHLDRVAIESDGNDVSRVDMAGEANLHDAAMNVGVHLSGVDGRLSGRIGWGESASMDLKLALETADVEGRTLTDVSGHLVEESDRNKLYLRNLQAGFYDGMLTGDIEISRQQGGSGYGVTLNIQEVSLLDFLNARRAAGEPQSEMKGVLSGNLAMAGRLGRPQSRRGGGSIVISRAELFKVPLMLAILQVIHLAIDDDNAIHDAKAGFVFDGEDLILQEIDMRGRSFSMVGAGRVHTPSQHMDVVLLVGSPLELPRVEILSDLVEGVARELMEVHLEGPVADPRIRAEIVRSMRATLETILNLRRSSGRE